MRERGAHKLMTDGEFGGSISIIGFETPRFPGLILVSFSADRVSLAAWGQGPREMSPRACVPSCCGITGSIHGERELLADL